VDIAVLVKAVTMGLVEGLMAFLPISSTGAIFAVILGYWQKIRHRVVALSFA
jgi:undecaprenyl pyrophosphate phosphatase UppP